MSGRQKRSLARWLSDGVHWYLETRVPTDPPMMSCMGYLVPLKPVEQDASTPDGRRPQGQDERAREEQAHDEELLLGWVRSGDLTRTEAEALLALDRSTRWQHERRI